MRHAPNLDSGGYAQWHWRDISRDRRWLGTRVAIFVGVKADRLTDLFQNAVALNSVASRLAYRHQCLAQRFKRVLADYGRQPRLGPSPRQCYRKRARRREGRIKLVFQLPQQSGHLNRRFIL
mgnify:CR=1 FL=1|jgi:hypothetical protein